MVRQVVAAAQDESLIAAVVDQVHRQDAEARATLEAERTAYARAIQGWHAEMKAADTTNEATLARLAEVQEMIAAAEARSRELDDKEARAVRLLIEQVDYDGGRGKVAIAFRPTDIRTLARERAEQRVEDTA